MLTTKNNLGHWEPRAFVADGALAGINNEPGLTDARAVHRISATAALLAATIIAGASLQHWGLPVSDMKNTVNVVTEVLATPASMVSQSAIAIESPVVDVKQSDARELTRSTTPHKLNSAAKARLAHYIHVTYRISDGFAKNIVHTVDTVARANDLSPILMLAIIGVESSYNTDALSSNRSAGLMQVHPESHPDILADLGVAPDNRKKVETTLKSNINLNIKAGAAVLSEYGERNESKELLLWRYNGRAKNPDGSKRLDYSAKVMKVEHLLSTVAFDDKLNNQLALR